MINIPIGQIKEKIAKKTGLSDEEISKKIKDKLKQLAGLISEEGAAHIVANELGVKLFEAGEPLQIKNIMPGMRNVDFAAKVLQKYEMREFNTEKGAGKVASMLVGDESGVIRLVFWQKQAEASLELKEGDVVKVVGGYVRENMGRKEVHVSEMSKFMINPRGVEINAKAPVTKEFVRKKISEIQETDTNVELLATIVQVFDLNFFEVCPKCNKRVRLREDGFMCQTHNKVEPEFNYVLNIYVDDGSDNIRVVLWREQVEQLLAMNRTQVLSFKQDPSGFEPLKTDLLGNIIIVAGRASKNQTFDRIELVASKIVKNPDPEAELKSLKEQVAKAPPEEKKPVEASKPEPKKEFRPAPPAKPARKDDGEMQDFDLDSELMDIEDL
jgi:hypothetical protein